MNKIFRAIIDLPIALFKCLFLKLRHGRNFNTSKILFMSPFSEITMDSGAKLVIGSNFRQRSQSRLRVRKNSEVYIGNNVSLNHGCMIVSHNSIKVGNGVQLGPNVLIYDHDHDFNVLGGINAGFYKTSPIEIGDNAWIGANSVILRGTVIGPGAVVAAGSIVKSHVPKNTIYVQKKEIQLMNYRSDILD